MEREQCHSEPRELESRIGAGASASAALGFPAARGPCRAVGTGTVVGTRRAGGAAARRSRAGAAAAGRAAAARCAALAHARAALAGAAVARGAIDDGASHAVARLRVAARGLAVT